MTNLTREYPVVVIDANLIGCKTPNGIEAEKCVELLATIFSSNVAGVPVHADHPSKVMTKKEKASEEKAKKRNTVMLHEKRAMLSSLLQHSTADDIESRGDLSKDIHSMKKY